MNKLEVERPGPKARETVMACIKEYYDQVKRDKMWNKKEKEDLLRFLTMQFNSWGMLADEIGSGRLARAKERILLQTWAKFTQGMGRRKLARKGLRKKSKSELKSDPSTAETVGQESGSILKAGETNSEAPLAETTRNVPDPLLEQTEGEAKPVKLTQ